MYLRSRTDQQICYWSKCSFFYHFITVIDHHVAGDMLGTRVTKEKKTVSAFQKGQLSRWLQHIMVVIPIEVGVRDNWNIKHNVLDTGLEKSGKISQLKLLWFRLVSNFLLKPCADSAIQLPRESLDFAALHVLICFSKINCVYVIIFTFSPHSSFPS